MNKKNLNNLLSKTKRTVLMMAAILTLLTGTVLAEDIVLRMEGASGGASINKGNTITRKISGISKIEGTLKLRFKWHSVSLVPNWFDRIKFVLRHDGKIIRGNECYSTHANKSPKCDFTLSISKAEAQKSGDWVLEITNNSSNEVVGFNIEKGSDPNPAVPNFKSIYTVNCRSAENLDMEGDTATLKKGVTVTRTFGIASKTSSGSIGFIDDPGTLTLRIKWHAVSIIPNTFNQLKIDVFDGNGNRVSALSGNFYSYHSNRTPKYDKTFQINNAHLGNKAWRIVVTNNSSNDVVDFNIEKGSDINPAVPAFKSTYKQKCP